MFNYFIIIYYFLINLVSKEWSGKESSRNIHQCALNAIPFIKMLRRIYAESSKVIVRKHFTGLSAGHTLRAASQCSAKGLEPVCRASSPRPQLPISQEPLGSASGTNNPKMLLLEHTRTYFSSSCSIETTSRAESWTQPSRGLPSCGVDLTAPAIITTVQGREPWCSRTCWKCSREVTRDTSSMHSNCLECVVWPH